MTACRRCTHPREDHVLYAERERMPWCRTCSGRCMGFAPGTPVAVPEDEEAFRDNVREGIGG